MTNENDVTEAGMIAKRLSKPQRRVLLSLSVERPQLLSHRESVSTLAMERVQIRPFIFAQLTKHCYARGKTAWDSVPTGQLTSLGETVRRAVLARGDHLDGGRG